MEYGFLNDSFTPVGSMKLHSMDLGIQRGFGVFDFFRLKNGQNAHLQLYFDRLYQSLHLAGLNIDYSQDELKGIINELIGKNDSPDSCIKIVVTGGTSKDGFSLSGKTSLLIFNLPYRPPSDNQYQNGVGLITQLYQRPCPKVKSTNYFYSLLLQQKISKYKAIDVLYYHPDSIFETSRTNIFVVKDKHVYTPSDGMLEGITRHKILHLHSKPFPLSTTTISKTQLDLADEVFISSTTKGILPIIQIDSKQVSNGQVGEVTKSYMKALAASEGL